MKDSIQDLLQWYEGSRRPLPWRLKPQPHPYEILVAEIMSQQSTMSTVIPYYEKWMRRFPDFGALAKAPPSAVLSHWAGLGYYARARNLHKTAKILCARFGAKHVSKQVSWPQMAPREAKEWEALPGIGPYTARAVAAIALGEAVLPVDGNVIRVSSRFKAIPDPLNNKADRLRVDSFVEDLAKSQAPGTHGPLAEALMELGSQICKPALPLCKSCPLSENCVAHQRDKVRDYPKAKIRKQSQSKVLLALLYGTNDKAKVMLRRIPEPRRLHGQWELPHMEISSERAEAFIDRLRGHFGVWGPIKHRITHHAYTVFGVSAGKWSGALPSEHKFFSQESKEAQIVLTTLTRKVLAARPM